MSLIRSSLTEFALSVSPQILFSSFLKCWAMSCGDDLESWRRMFLRRLIIKFNSILKEGSTVFSRTMICCVGASWVVVVSLRSMPNGFWSFSFVTISKVYVLSLRSSSDSWKSSDIKAFISSLRSCCQFKSSENLHPRSDLGVIILPASNEALVFRDYSFGLISVLVV